MNLNADFFKIKHNNIAPSKGKILVSEPFSNDMFFKRSVVLLAEHDDEHSIGFILNKSVNFSLHEILKDFPNVDANISIGGPVKTDTIHYIHTLGDIIPHSIHIKENLYWGGDFTALKLLLEVNKIKENDIRFFIGYSGWSPKQLKQEIEKDYWLVSEISVSDIMQKKNDIWQISLEQLDKKYQVWKNFPENPSMN